MTTTITALPAASALTGTEPIPTDQGGSTKRTSAQAIRDYTLSKPTVSPSYENANSRTLTASDDNRILVISPVSGSSVTVTLPQDSTAALPAGFRVLVMTDGTGATLSFAAQGSDTILSAGGTSISQYEVATVIKLVSGEWLLDVAGSGGGVATALSALSDVSLTSPQKGDALVYNGSEWINRPSQYTVTPLVAGTLTTSVNGGGLIVGRGASNVYGSGLDGNVRAYVGPAPSVGNGFVAVIDRTGTSIETGAMSGVCIRNSSTGRIVTISVEADGIRVSRWTNATTFLADVTTYDMAISSPIAVVVNRYAASGWDISMTLDELSGVLFASEFDGWLGEADQVGLFTVVPTAAESGRCLCLSWRVAPSSEIGG